MILLTEFYNPTCSKRKEEILTTLKHNIKCSEITTIALFIEHFEEDDEVPNHSKIKIVRKMFRPSFKDMMEYARDNYNGEIIIIANSDIHFDSSLNSLKNIDMNTHFIALSKYDVDGQTAELYDKSYSQDSWIFKGGLVLEADYLLGTLGIDNKIPFLANSQGLKVINPCYDICSFHLHSEKIRKYKGIIEGPYLLVRPSKVGMEPSIRIISYFTPADLEF